MAPARRYVLDANALVGFFEGRSGVSERVKRLLEESLRLDIPLMMSAVNWGEVFYVAWQKHGGNAARKLESDLHDLPIAVLAADSDRATRAATIKQTHHLGYADAFAAELALERDAWLVTADPDFSRLGNLLKLIALPRHKN